MKLFIEAEMRRVNTVLAVFGKRVVFCGMKYLYKFNKLWIVLESRGGQSVKHRFSHDYSTPSFISISEGFDFRYCF